MCEVGRLHQLSPSLPRTTLIIRGLSRTVTTRLSNITLPHTSKKMCLLSEKRSKIMRCTSKNLRTARPNIQGPAKTPLVDIKVSGRLGELHNRLESPSLFEGSRWGQISICTCISLVIVCILTETKSLIMKVVFRYPQVPEYERHLFQKDIYCTEVIVMVSTYGIV